MPHWFYVFMGNAAMALNLASFWMVDVRKLRMVAIASSVCFVIYSLIVPAGPLWIMVAWSLVFLLVNLYRLVTDPRRLNARGATAVAQVTRDGVA